jgi:hypothetical protein
VNTRFIRGLVSALLVALAAFGVPGNSFAVQRAPSVIVCARKGSDRVSHRVAERQLPPAAVLRVAPRVSLPPYHLRCVNPELDRSRFQRPPPVFPS